MRLQSTVGYINILQKKTGHSLPYCNIPTKTEERNWQGPHQICKQIVEYAGIVLFIKWNAKISGFEVSISGPTACLRVCYPFA